MPLVKCSDCGHEISDQAPACINCGRPIRPDPADQKGKKVVTELTSKNIKSVQAVGALLVVVGGFLFFKSTESSAYTIYSSISFVSGLVILLCSEISRWWHHG